MLHDAASVTGRALAAPVAPEVVEDDVALAGERVGERVVPARQVVHDEAVEEDQRPSLATLVEVEPDHSMRCHIPIEELRRLQTRKAGAHA